MVLPALVSAALSPGAPAVELAPQHWDLLPFHAVQLHIHGSLSEGSARMVDQAWRSRQAGVDLLWWSDHEPMTYVLPEHRPALCFDFETAALTRLEAPFDERGFYDLDSLAFVDASVIDSTAFSGQFAMALQAHQLARPERGSAEPGAVFPQFDGYRYTTNKLRLEVRSMLQDIELDLALRPPAQASAGRAFAVHCELSRDARRERPLELCFVFMDGGAPLPEDNATTFYHAVDAPQPGVWSRMTLPITAVARALVPLGEDSHLGRLSLGWLDCGGRGSSGCYLVDDFQLRVDGPEGGELLKRQAELLAGYPRPPLHFVGTELSRGFTDVSPEHLNLFAPRGIPLLPDWGDPRYVEWEYPGNIVRWAQAEGYGVSLNHIFTARVEGWISEEVRARRREAVIGNLAYGADFIEVGYPARGLPIEEHLDVWDQLLRLNSFQTGLGTSDSHDAWPWQQVINRFVTWVPAQSLTQERVLDRLLRGQVFFGDPTVAGADARLLVAAADGRFAMGDVVICDASELEIQYAGASELPLLDLALLTVHREHTDTLRVSHGGGPFSGRWTAQISAPCHVRVEARDGISHDLVLGTNPIHFRRAAPPRDRPGLRARRLVDLRLR